MDMYVNICQNMFSKRFCTSSDNIPATVNLLHHLPPLSFLLLPLPGCLHKFQQELPDMGSPEAGRPGHGEAAPEDRTLAATGHIADHLTTSVSSHMRMRLERNTSCQTTGSRHGQLACKLFLLFKEHSFWDNY